MAATCTKTGLTEGSHCSVCKKVIIAQEVIYEADAATGHNFANYVCVDCGYNYYTDGLEFILLNDEYSVTGYTGLECNVIIPAVYNNKPVISIGSYVFSGCTSITSITIPNSITTIGQSAFHGCTSLTSVTIGSGVTTIGWYAFYCCTSLTSVTIGSGVTTIGKYAFNYCSSLESITIPNSVTSIGDRAFTDCSSLETVYYKGTKEQWNSISISTSGNSNF